MMTSDAARRRSDYLAQLDAAMANVPHGVATEIRAGIAEELAGLDSAATAARIEQLGDPAVIAREAGAAIAPVAVTVQQKEPLAQSRGFAITAALVLAFGGFIVPVLGWFVGAVMVTIGARWRRWEKLVAIALPFAAAALTAIVIWITALISPADGSTHNPLVPAPFDMWHSGILLAFLVVPVSGGWLLWRLRGR